MAGRYAIGVCLMLGNIHRWTDWSRSFRTTASQRNMLSFSCGELQVEQQHFNMAANELYDDDCFTFGDNGKDVFTDKQIESSPSYLSMAVKALPTCVSQLTIWLGFCVAVRVTPIVAHFATPFFDAFWKKFL